MEITVNFDKWHDELLTKLDENGVNHWMLPFWKELPKTNFAFKLRLSKTFPRKWIALALFSSICTFKV